MRVSDILTRNIVLELQQWDVLDIGSAKAGSGKGQHMLKLISAMKDIEISFDIWASRKSGQDLDFTSLTTEKNLPEKFTDILQPDICSEVKCLWEEFSALYDFVSAWTPEGEGFASFSSRGQDWIAQFCALGDRRLGFQRANVTPYMHNFASHIEHTLSVAREVNEAVLLHLD